MTSLDEMTLEELQAHPLWKNLAPFLFSIRGESPRGAVLISAAVIDDLLSRTIEAFLVEGFTNRLLTGFNAPLGTFSARIEMAAALGLISSDERHNAVIVRRVRNEFAHTMEASFESHPIVQRCAEFRIDPYWDGSIFGSAQGRFQLATAGLVLDLEHRPRAVAPARLSPRKWPME